MRHRLRPVPERNGWTVQGAGTAARRSTSRCRWWTGSTLSTGSRSRPVARSSAWWRSAHGTSRRPSATACPRPTRLAQRRNEPAGHRHGRCASSTIGKQTARTPPRRTSRHGFDGRRADHSDGLPVVAATWDTMGSTSAQPANVWSAASMRRGSNGSPSTIPRSGIFEASKGRDGTISNSIGGQRWRIEGGLHARGGAAHVEAGEHRVDLACWPARSTSRGPMPRPSTTPSRRHDDDREAHRKGGLADPRHPSAIACGSTTWSRTL